MNLEQLKDAAAELGYTVTERDFSVTFRGFDQVFMVQKDFNGKFKKGIKAHTVMAHKSKNFGSIKTLFKQMEKDAAK